MVSVCGGWVPVPVAVPLGAPDALVHAGGARFAAHARLLAAHSGYFKSVLGARRNSNNVNGNGAGAATATATATATAAAAAAATASSDETVLYVPNVSAQQFWPLLAYMYTGYLDLSPDNIYQVLLATHLLHMPRALDLCRNFLAQTRPSLPPTIVKPIPSRKLPPFLSSNLFRPLYSENSPVFRSVNETSFRTPDNAFQDEEKKQTVPSQSFPSRSAADVAETETTLRNVQKENKDVEFSHDSGSSYISVGTVTYDSAKAEDQLQLLLPPKIIDKTTVNKPKMDNENEEEEETAEKFKDKLIEGKTNCVAQNDDKVIVDIACCDGPVRFHRVLNRAYKNSPEGIKDVAELTDSDDSYIEVEEDTRSKCENLPYDNCNAFSKSLQKQMSENIKTMTGLQSDDNQDSCFNGEASQSTCDGNNREQSSTQQESIYTCVYCKHTFKSQYCYQKHARRHLNPVSIDAVNQEGPESVCRTRPNNPGQPPAVRREVRLLDMNVQYYPCKTCGSKFPSYYFVHKHRKMCHANELDGADNNNPKGSSTSDRKRKNSSAKETKSSLDVNEHGGGANMEVGDSCQI